MPIWFKRCLALFRRDRLERRLDDEVRAHLELLAAEYERRGMTRADARAAARRAFGGVEQIKEIHRERRGLPWVEIVRQDVTYAGRQLRHAPGFALAAILTLALCIGANVAVFTVVDEVLFRPLAYADGDRLVTLYSRLDPFGRIPVSNNQFGVWRPSLKSFDGVALIFGYQVNLSGSGEPERVAGARVSPELFRILGVRPQLGRLLRADEDLPGRDHVLVVSHDLWCRRFNADPALVGRTITVDGEPYEIVGVLPAEFRFPAVSRLYSIPVDAARPEIWKPFALRENDPFSENNFAAIGRLAAGVTIDQAQSEVDALQEAVLRSRGPSNAFPADVVPLRDQITGGSRRGLEVLLAAVAAVLLIACVNVTNLILVRSSARRRELAVRSALGASRRRLAWQLFTEGVVLASLGGVLGVAIATLAVRLIVLTAPIDIPRLDEIQIDGGILRFAALIVAITAAVVGLLPALRVLHASMEGDLTAGMKHSASTPERRAGVTQSTLVAVQVSLTVVCAVTAGLLLQSLTRLLSVDKGFDAQNVVTATLSLAGPSYTGRRVALQRELIDRLEHLPGVTSVAISSQQLLGGTGMNLRVAAEGSTAPIFERPLVNFRSVNSDYFRALGVAFERGRTFDETDTSPVAVVSRSTAERLWPGQDAVGRRFRRGPDTLPPVEIVGVVADVRTSRLEQPPGLTIYLPYWQSSTGDIALAVKTSVDASAVAPAIRSVVHSLDPELPVANLSTMANVVANSVGERRFLTSLVALFAIGALMLAAVGIYGVLSQSVAQRTRELGIRVALGARREAVVRYVLTEAWRLIAVGLALGVAMALASGSLLRSVLFDVVPNDPVTIAAVCVVLGAAATLAAYAPARRASRVDPMVALRSE